MLCIPNGDAWPCEGDGPRSNFILEGETDLSPGCVLDAWAFIVYPLMSWTFGSEGTRLCCVGC